MNATRIALVVAAIALLGGIVDIVIAPRRARSDIQALVRTNPESSSFIRHAAHAGHPVREQRWVPLADIAPVAACAVVFAEDRAYYDHGTLDWDAQRALLTRVLHGDFSRGGSGLPQQLARNLFLSPDRTVARKAKEYLLAYEISHALSKDRLLELYLNLAEWGDGVWGVEAASQHYFGVSANLLSPTQATVLASFLPAPRSGWRYPLSERGARSQDNTLRKLWRARLISDQDLGAIMDRLREWRKQSRRHNDPLQAWRRTDALLGPEPAPAEGSHDTKLPLKTLCDTRRRGV